MVRELVSSSSVKGRHRVAVENNDDDEVELAVNLLVMRK